jgi:thiamine transport system substrate-binding protein
MEQEVRGPLRPRSLLTVSMALLLAAASSAASAADEPTVTFMTHDSFYLPDAVIEAFEAEHGVDVQVLHAGDAGSMVNQAILTTDRPLADVLFGIDNTFLSRALEAGIFEPYLSPALASVPAELVVDPEHRVTPIDYGDVCLNIDPAGLAAAGLSVPARLEDLTDPALRGALVVENPATSSPGLAFLLATVAYFGEDPETGWTAYWRDLVANDVAVTAGWEEAYYGGFSGGSGEGDRPIVVSYATSPAAEVIFGPDPETDVSPTAAVDSGCFRQIEFAGILRGTEEPDLAGLLIDHLLAAETQAEIPLSMYVYPARSGVDLPEVFERHALVPSQPLSMEPAAIDEGRESWIREWTDIVLR